MKKIYIIAGGGTGGHVYPGVAVAHALLKLEPTCEVVFVGTAAGLETRIVPREGFRLELIEVGKLNFGSGIFEGLFQKIKVLLRLPLGLWQSFLILKRLQPVAVLGVGGYASGPFVLVASWMGFPTALWEANAHPGLTNRLLSHFVRKAYLVFADAKALLGSARSTQVIGLPVRAEIENPPLSTASDEFRILVFGGSQGSRALNKAMATAIEKGGDWLRGVHVIHQTGTADFKEVRERYSKLDEKIQKQVSAHEFLYDMHEQYSNCDLVICRGGAGTVTELAACGKVSIVVPLPTAADDHQTKNAQSLVAGNAGKMIEQKNLTAETLIAEIQNLRTHPEVRAEISNNIRKLFIPRAATTMAREMSEGVPL